MQLRYLIYLAYRYFRRGEPLPIDLYGALVRSGVSPEKLEACFEEGYSVKEIADVVKWDLELLPLSALCPLCGGEGCIHGC